MKKSSKFRKKKVSKIFSPPSALLLTPLRQDVTFLLQTAFNTNFNNPGLADVYSRFLLAHKIRFSFR